MIRIKLLYEKPWPCLQRCSGLDLSQSQTSVNTLKVVDIIEKVSAHSHECINLQDIFFGL